MALTDEGNGNGFYMPVAPAYGAGYGNGGGFFGGDWAWILLLLLIGGGGWGLGGFGGGMMWPMMMGGMGAGFGNWGLDYLYPWLNNSQHISDGFRDQTLQTSITGLQNSVTSGFGDVQNALCGGFAGVNAGIANAAAQAEISENARQMSLMQQLFGMQSAQQQCCCENRAGLADIKYTVATENCADRQALSDGIRDVIAAQTAGVQRIIDKLCDQELQAERRDNANLRSELMYARGQASQVAQTAELRTAAQTANANLLSELRSCPIPTYSVYGNVPVYTCGCNNGTGCGCNGFAA